MTRQFLRNWGWLPLLCLAIAALAIYAWIAAGADARALARDGIIVEARVTALDHVVFRKPSNQNRSDDFLVSVSFTTGKATDGSLALHEEKRSVSEAFFATLTTGQALPIRVLPDDPSVIEVEPGWVEGNAGAAGWVGAGFLLLGLLPLPFLLRVAAANDRTLTRGLRRSGEVVEVLAVNGYHILRYRWQGADGALHEGRSRPASGAGAFAGLSAGDPVALLEDPEDPARALLVPRDHRRD